MTFFIALTFSADSLHYQKVDSFRRRFDSKYWKGPSLNLSLLPPFKLPQMGQKMALKKLQETLSEEIENHMQDLMSVNEIPFRGLDFTTGRKSVLYLKPHMPLDLVYCSEALLEIVGDFGASFKKRKVYRGDYTSDDDTRAFLPVGRFHDPFLTEAAVETARFEFPHEFSLRADSITLFEITADAWIPKCKLFTFSTDEVNLWEESIGFGIHAPVLARG